MFVAFTTITIESLSYNGGVAIKWQSEQLLIKILWHKFFAFKGRPGSGIGLIAYCPFMNSEVR